MNAWRTTFEALFPEVVPVAALTSRSASATAALCSSGAYTGALLTECRVNGDTPGSAVLFLEVAVPLGQRKAVNDVHAVEPICVYILGSDVAPLAYPLREDFPEHLPHLNASWAGEPRSLCLFEMPPEEILRIATPHVMMERIRWWLAESAHGRLHGEHQPLDPVFAVSGRPLVLPPSGIDGLGTKPLAAVSFDEAKDAPAFLIEDTGRIRAELHRYTAIVTTTAPLPNGTVRSLPRTLADLVQAYAEAGADVADPLRDALRRWVGLPDIGTALGCPCILVVSTPLERQPGVVERVDTKAFHAGSITTGQVAAALGALVSHSGSVSRPFPDIRPDVAAMQAVALSALDVHASVDRRLARAASGRDGIEGDDRAVTLIGAGALGSQLALCAARMGIGRWIVVDPDYLLPHNLSRHALQARHLGMAKATAIAGEIEAMLGPIPRGGSLPASRLPRRASP